MPVWGGTWAGDWFRNWFGQSSSGGGDSGLQPAFTVDGGFNVKGHGAKGKFLAQTLGVDGSMANAHNVSGSVDDTHGVAGGFSDPGS